MGNRDLQVVSDDLLHFCRQVTELVLYYAYVDQFARIITRRCTDPVDDFDLLLRKSHLNLQGLLSPGMNWNTSGVISVFWLICSALINDYLT